jgi:hypothetical protein
MTRGIDPPIDGLYIAEHHGEEGSIVRLRGRLNIDSSPCASPKCRPSKSGGIVSRPSPEL